MASFALDSSGDLVFTDGKLQMLYDDEAILQSLRTRLLLCLGDWFLDLGEGTDWIGSILGKHDDSVRRAELRRRAVGTDGVASVQRIEITHDYASRESSARVYVVLESGRAADVRVSTAGLGGVS